MNMYDENVIFSTKFGDMKKHNGERVTVIGYQEGRTPRDNRYTIIFKDGTKLENVYASELSNK